jgi:hypothetical protein
MAVWRRRKRQVSDISGPSVGVKRDRQRGPRAANVTRSFVAFTPMPPMSTNVWPGTRRAIHWSMTFLGVGGGVGTGRVYPDGASVR